ncbi:class II fructose-bisphosphate aldolase [Rhodoferax sp. BAB1]|jgi:fructose-bisphosphate aldolase class II|uniref:class II fructose-bisphosphate aldolase n=1 Tax=Rhodoferax sp. BAB1 TaxID=2741720 RepID=UPI001575F8A1|nr:class II fructose-bisphosphate aldolase [Rhodoferax sp. BAB1]QKO20612.1 fructose-bisphosphate aldolase class II [Rhodoferax sp. BAB1]
MAFASLRQVLDHAAEHGYGVPAFNVNNLEQVLAIMEAAQETDSPVILQASAGARKYAGEPYLRHLMLAAVESHPDIPVVVHQDHGTSAAVCQQSIRSGFTSVMMDGSLMTDGKTPASYDYNVDITRRVCEMAHPVGVSVEGELGCLGSLETGEAGEEDGVGAEGKLTHDMMLTDPVQAKDFVAKTGVDALAIAIGTSHGAYKFTRKPTGDILAIDRIAAIHAQIPNTHLVMHGSSSVPQEWLAIIRQYGGDIKETYGVPVEEIQRGIKSGVRKINIDTDIRLAMTGAMREIFAKQPSEFDPRKALAAAKKAARGVVKARFEAFGCAGMASKMKPIALEAMAARYA